MQKLHNVKKYLKLRWVMLSIVPCAFLRQALKYFTQNMPVMQENLRLRFLRRHVALEHKMKKVSLLLQVETVQALKYRLRFLLQRLLQNKKDKQLWSISLFFAFRLELEMMVPTGTRLKRP